MFFLKILTSQFMPRKKKEKEAISGRQYYALFCRRERRRKDYAFRHGPWKSSIAVHLASKKELNEKGFC